MVKNAIKVYARLKPEEDRRFLMNYKVYRRPKERTDEDFLVLTAASKSSEYIDHRPATWNFSFYQVFDVTVNQSDVFEHVALPVIQSTLNGYNGTIFAYGQTGSGKTFSITGNKESYDNRGIIPRTLQYIFKDISQHPENVYSVEVAYLEIYNENGYDLLDRKSAIARLEDLPRVTIQEDESGKLRLKNLIFHRVESEEDALEMLLIGDGNRVTAETPMNPNSSRSHCIFTIVISVKQFGADKYKRAKMHLVDLAGSERVYKCSISGTTLTEAKHINLSLHYLEQVIVCLGQETAGHIPYRNSLLTAILRDSLGGNCLTAMLATLSAASINIEETISTCRFAQRVALVRNDVDLVLDNSTDCENVLLRLENERLRKQIEMLQVQTVDRTGELTESEKKVLDGRVEKFVNSNVSISWDNDARKVSYCFSRLKSYFQKLLARKDREISSFVDTLRKEKLKNSSTHADSHSADDVTDDKTRMTEKNIILPTPKSGICKKKDNPTFAVAPCKILSLNLNDGFINDREAVASLRLKEVKPQTNIASSQVDTTPIEHKEKLSSGRSLQRKFHKKQEISVTSPRSQLGKEKESESRKHSSDSSIVFSPALTPTVQQTVEINFPAKKTNITDLDAKRAESITAFDFIDKLRDDLQAKLTARTNSPITEIVNTRKSCPSANQRSKEIEVLQSPRNTTDFDRKSRETDSHGFDIPKPCSSSDYEFEKTLPLTGDPEIDEEIIAFYKAKRMGGKY